MTDRPMVYPPGTIVPTSGAPVKHREPFYDDHRTLIYPGGIEVAPHNDGPDGGWFWRIDPDVSRARLGNFNDWSGPEDSPEAAFLAAIRFLIAYAASHYQLNEELFGSGIYSADAKLEVIERFFPNFARQHHDPASVLKSGQWYALPSGQWAQAQFGGTTPTWTLVVYNKGATWTPEMTIEVRADGRLAVAPPLTWVRWGVEHLREATPDEAEDCTRKISFSET